jgi:hypothetical protein
MREQVSGSQSPDNEEMMMSLKEILKKEIEREQQMMYKKKSSNENSSSLYVKSTPHKSTDRPPGLNILQNSELYIDSSKRTRNFEENKYATRNIDLENQ